MEKPDHSSRVGPIAALTYLYLPFLLFDLGWIRRELSMPIAAFSFLGFVMACRKTPNLWLPRWSWRIATKAFSCVAVLGLWVWSAGIGGYVWGNIDHLARNTVFKMLVERTWPLYSIGIPGVLPDAEPSILCYYVGFFLPPAVIGKLTSLQVGFFALWCWATFGVCLAYYFLCAKMKRLLVWPILVFIFFSGADSIGVILRGLHHPGVIPFWSPTTNFEQWSAYNYSCQTTQLFWVYNQTIPAWIATSFLLCGFPASISLFVASCLMINSTFAFVGICILILSSAFFTTRRENQDEFGKQGLILPLFRHVSYTNLLGIVFIGIPSYAYLSGNTAGSRFGLYFHWTYFLFILLEVFVPLLPLYRRQRSNPLFWTILFALLLLPFGTVGFGRGGDFHFRVSIPLLFVILYWYVDSIDVSVRRKHWSMLSIFCATLLLGLPTPCHEMSRTLVNTCRFGGAKKSRVIPGEPESAIMQPGRYYFTAPIAGNWFSRHMAKKAN